jgi:hypothetical protein
VQAHENEPDEFVHVAFWLQLLPLPSPMHSLASRHMPVEPKNPAGQPQPNVPGEFVHVSPEGQAFG